MKSIFDRNSNGAEEAPGARTREERNVEAPAAQSIPDGAAACELRKLKVASIERLVREIRARHPGATRASVMGELSRMRVKRFGVSIVALEDLWA